MALSLLELFNLLVNPLENDYALTWHRDAIRADASSAEEAAKLLIRHHGVQWNAALYADDCLSAVPGSHARVRTQEEREANLAENGTSMPGARVVSLKEVCRSRRPLLTVAALLTLERRDREQQRFTTTVRLSNDVIFVAC